MAGFISCSWRRNGIALHHFFHMAAGKASQWIDNISFQPTMERSMPWPNSVSKSNVFWEQMTHRCGRRRGGRKRGGKSNKNFTQKKGFFCLQTKKYLHNVIQKPNQGTLCGVYSTPPQCARGVASAHPTPHVGGKGGHSAGVRWWVCDVMWYDVRMCDVMWCDIIWCENVWCDMMWCGVMW